MHLSYLQAVSKVKMILNRMKMIIKMKMIMMKMMLKTANMTTLIFVMMVMILRIIEDLYHSYSRLRLSKLLFVRSPLTSLRRILATNQHQQMESMAKL